MTYSNAKKSSIQIGPRMEKIGKYGGFTSFFLGIILIILARGDTVWPFPEIWPSDLPSFYLVMGMVTLLSALGALKHFYSNGQILWYSFVIVVYTYIIIITVVFGINSLLKYLEIGKDLLGLWPF